LAESAGDDPGLLALLLKPLTRPARAGLGASSLRIALTAADGLGSDLNCDPPVSFPADQSACVKAERPWAAPGAGRS